MKAFIDRCILAIKEKQSPLMVGLDPHYSKLPPHLIRDNKTLEDAGDAICKFNFKIIDAVHDLIPIVKPQIAFYEKFGLPGIKAYAKTIEYANSKGLLVVGDVKRNDIGSTAEAYSEAYLGATSIAGNNFTPFAVDAITVNPYLGSDGISPFIKDAQKFGKGIFVLVKTSNKSSGEFQDVLTNKDGKELKLHELVATYVNSWGQSVLGESGYSSVGAVVGATYPNEIKILRSLMPSTFFLVPGIGAQGGAIDDILDCFNNDGLGALINVSRSVIFAYQDNPNFKSEEFDKAAREEVKKLNKELREKLG